MKSLLLLIPLLPVCAFAQSTPQPREAVLALTHVTVIDLAGAPPQTDVTVTITGHRIAAIAPAGRARVPAGAVVVNAAGKFLIPGLWDMHVHPFGKEYLPLFTANGITGIRVMWGFPEHHEWRTAIEAGSLSGPHMYIAGPIVDGPKPFWPGSIGVASEAQARQAVDQTKKYGADFVKVYQGLPRDLFFAIADEARRQDISFAGHVPISVTAEEASNAGQKTFEHLIGILPACSTRAGDILQAQQADLAEGIAASKLRFWGPHYRELREAMLDTYSPEKASALSAVLKRNGTWQCPTLTLLHMFGYGDDPAFLHDPRLKYVPQSERADWSPTKIDGTHTPADFAFSRREFQKDLAAVAAMQRAGVGILAGTDSGNPYCFPGFGLHDELAFLVQAGLTPLEALRTATVNPARFLANERDFGSVQPGKIADLVLLDANPLDNIANTRKIFAVISNGTLYNRAALDGMLAQVEAFAARKPVSEIMFPIFQEKGIAAAVQTYRDLAASQPGAYDLTENQLITLGYRLIHLKKYLDAVETFKLAVEVYPRSYNTYDSLAEAYLDAGNKDLAIANYRKSLDLNPDNSNAVKVLKTLVAQ